MTTNPLNINDSGLPIFNATTGAFSAVAATTKGDLIVHNGTNYTRLGVGANNKILLANSGESTGLLWGDLSFTGNWVLVDSAVASSSSSIEFTNLDPALYATYFISLVDIHSATDNVSLQCLMSVNNGSSFLSSAYKYVYRIMDTGSGADDENHSSSASYIEVADRIGNAAGEGIAGWFWYLPSATPATQLYQSIEWQLYGQDTGTDLNGYWGGGLNSTTSDVDALQFKFSSGNIESGNFYLYGLEVS